MRDYIDTEFPQGFVGNAKFQTHSFLFANTETCSLINFRLKALPVPRRLNFEVKVN